jgi:hypothetical protein
VLGAYKPMSCAEKNFLKEVEKRRKYERKKKKREDRLEN